MSEPEAKAIYQEEADRVSREQFEKFGLLFKHYGIDAQSDGKARWMKLAFWLAFEFVPGMQVVAAPPRKRGRPPKWKGRSDSLVLVETVERIQQERKKGILDAVRTAKRRFPNRWPYDPQTLVTRYYEARATAADMRKNLEAFQSLVE